MSLFALISVKKLKSALSFPISLAASSTAKSPPGREELAVQGAPKWGKKIEISAIAASANFLYVVIFPPNIFRSGALPVLCSNFKT
jgi:hypothetical protein